MEQFVRESAEAGDDPVKQRALYRLLSKYDHDEWNDPNLAARWMNGFSSSGSNVWDLINVKEHVSEYVEADDWEGLAKFVHEALTAAWINSFMSYTRKI